VLETVLDNNLEIRSNAFVSVFKLACRTGEVYASTAPTDQPLSASATGTNEKADEYLNEFASLAATNSNGYTLVGMRHCQDFWSRFHNLVMGMKHANPLFGFPLNKLVEINGICNQEKSLESVVDNHMLVSSKSLDVSSYMNDYVLKLSDRGNDRTPLQAGDKQSYYRSVLSDELNPPSWSESPSYLEHEPDHLRDLCLDGEEYIDLEQPVADRGTGEGATPVNTHPQDEIADWTARKKSTYDYDRVSIHSINRHRRQRLLPVTSDECLHSNGHRNLNGGKYLPARLVGVAVSEDVCPHCGDQLSHNSLTALDRSFIRAALLKLSRRKNATSQHLLVFFCRMWYFFASS
jgi:hypothetical protein